MAFDEDRQLLRDSGLFVAEWYAARYADVTQTGLDPETHYLRYGRLLLRDPGPGFDARGYLDAYADVRAAGSDPLFHYLRHGRAEGRAGHAADLAAVAHAESLAAHLWGGLGEEIAPALLAFLQDDRAPPQARHAAGLQLAVWRAYAGDTATALELLDQAGAVSSGQARLPALQMRRALLLGRMGRAEEGLAALDLMSAGHRATVDAQLAAAALNSDPAARLAALNAVWAEAGLAQVTADGPPGPDSLQPPALPPAPDHGLVSVIVPAFRAGSVLAAALRSILGQSYRNLEVLVVDDASPDDTATIARAFAGADDRLRLIAAPANGGAYVARNLGLAQARGAFITTHDADDWSHPEKIARQVAALVAAPGAMATVSDWLRIRPGLEPSPGWRLNEALVQYNHSSFLFRRALTQTMGGWDPVRVAGDTEFIWRCEAQFGADSVLRVLRGLPLTLGREDEGSLTRVRATHVRSIYHGLRHYYREICRHWHSHPAGATPEGRARRLAMLPPAILDPAAPPPAFDRVVTGDFRHAGDVARMAAAAAEGGRTGLAHRPDPAVPASPAPGGVRFCPDLFTLLEQPDVGLALPGTAGAPGSDDAARPDIPARGQ